MGWFWKIKNIPINNKLEDRNIHSIKANTWKLLFSYFAFEMNEHSYKLYIMNDSNEAVDEEYFDDEDFAGNSDEQISFS